MGAEKRNPGRKDSTGAVRRDGSAPHVLRLGACFRGLGNCAARDGVSVRGLVHQDARIPGEGTAKPGAHLDLGWGSGYHGL